MKFKPIQCTTKSGISIQIREGKPTDSNGLIECIRAYLNDHSIPLTLEELESGAVGSESWIQKFVESKNDLLLVAEYNGQIIGNIDLTMNSRKMLSHTGYIGMGVHPGFQSQGAGTLLLEKLIEWAAKNPDIEILWLQVFASNKKGIRLYEQAGFENSGVQKGFIRHAVGTYTDNIIMTKYVMDSHS